MSQKRHRLLERQLRRFAPDAIPEEFDALLDAISDAYVAADEDRAMLERSMDISSSELVSANENLVRANEAAHAAAEAKGEFLAMMSHEIRTPINGIIGMTGLLMETELDDEQRDFAGTVESSADSLLSIINDILDYSKIEAGGMEFERTPCDLRRLSDDAIGVVAQQAVDHNVELCQLVEEQVPAVVECDPTRVRQILLNLLSNAVKFTDSGDVSLRVSAGGDGEFLRFSVSDTGIGIPEDRLDRLFQTFSQVDTSTTRRFGGTGLGLAICKRLAEGMGGEIGVESEEGAGSTFWFTIPMRVSEATAEATNAFERPDLSGLRVLVVDDNETNRKFMRYLIVGWDGEYGEAIDGPEALRMLSAEPGAWDLVLLDFQMPGMDGEQVLRHIRNDPTTRETPVVMLTSVADVKLARRLTELGLDGYLTKPIRHASLVQLLGNHVAQRANGTSRTEAGARFGRVLVVDDNPANRKLLTSILSREDYEFAEASDGDEAVAMQERAPFDLVLMDLAMPRCDGFEATRRMRQLARGGDVPVVGVSADTDAGASCRAAGMNDFLPKPVDRVRLLEVIALLEGRDPAAPAPAAAPAALEPAQSQREATPAPAGAPATSGAHVLLAEDHPANQKFATALLTKLGYSFEVVENGLEAVAAFGSGAFDAILMDVMMPEMDGLEATRCIRDAEQETGRHTPIIALTANVRAEDEAACLEAGADEFCPKPVTVAKLREVLGRWVDESKRSAVRAPEPPQAPAPPVALEPPTPRFAPVPVAPTETTLPFERRARGASGGPRVLLVDDNELNRVVMSRQVERLGYTVIESPNGCSALGMFVEADVGLVLLDYRMPDMNGSEVAAGIRRLEVEHDLMPCPILGLTAGVSDRAMREFLEAGADDVMIKPTPLGVLEKALTALLPGARPGTDSDRRLAEIRDQAFNGLVDAPARSAAAAAPARPEPQLDPRAGTILVASSSSIGLRVLERAAENVAEAVQSARGMDDVLILLEEGDPAVLVLDVELGGDLEDVLGTAWAGGVPVITVGPRGVSFEEAALHLPKPFDPVDLQRAIVELAERRAA